MENKRQVYLLDPQKYSPETIAVAFAKTSRSPESFLQIASELNETKSAQFNDKWVVGYGHSSVAEHAVLHIAVENISRLACECLESNRLASYTEKSTRYQTWDADAFYIPNELESSPLLQEYIQTCHCLLDTYQALIPAVLEQLAKENPLAPNEQQSAWERRIRALTIDNCRFMLPSAVLANVGMTINARALEHALVKMLSHPLEEVRRIGGEIKACAVRSIPTLLKYADADEYLTSSTAPLQLNHFPVAAPGNEWCKLIYSEPDAEARILAAYVYRSSGISYTQALDWVRRAESSEKAHLAESILNLQNPHSIPLRELEHAVFTFDVQLDQGAFYEVKRHRMMSLTPQNLSAELGYALPKAIVSAGQDKLYCKAMDQAQAAYRHLAQEYPNAASYIVPNAYNRRFLITSNFRSLMHFIRLRSAPNAHFSVRRFAQCLTRELSEILPAFAPYLPINHSESVASVESTFFSETMKVNENDQ
jgi:thymidylate synthase ThyX